MSSVLCLVAHPDDETILCGGALALLAARGAVVHVGCLTRGEGGETGEPPVCLRPQLGQVRSEELGRAARALGVHGVHFLDYVDPEAKADGTLFAPAHDPDALTGQITALIRRTDARVVLTHGSNGEYGHPAHQLMHARVLAACAAAGPSLWLYSFAAAFPGHPYPRLANADDPADRVLDVSAAMDQKETAALCHATQTALFVRRRSQAAGRPLTVRDVLLPVEGFRRWQGAPTDDRFAGWLEPWWLPESPR